MTSPLLLTGLVSYLSCGTALCIFECPTDSSHDNMLIYTDSLTSFLLVEVISIDLKGKGKIQHRQLFSPPHTLIYSGDPLLEFQKEFI